MLDYFSVMIFRFVPQLLLGFFSYGFLLKRWNTCWIELRSGDWPGKFKTSFFQLEWMHFYEIWQTGCFCRMTSEFILLLPLWVTSSIKINEPIPEAAMQAQAMKLAHMFWIKIRSSIILLKDLILTVIECVLFVIWSLCFCHWICLWTVNWGTFIHALWKWFHWLRSFFYSSHKFLSSPVFLKQPVNLYISGFFLLQDHTNCCTVYAQSLCNGSEGFFLFSQNNLLFSYRQPSGFCWFIILTTNVAFQGETQGLNQE